jgi:Fic family protein
MKSLTALYLKNLSLSLDDAQTLKRLGEYKGKQDLFKEQTPQILETLKQTSIIESSESSNRLEGILASRDKIEALVNKKTTPQNRSEQEIAGYRDALDMIHESAAHMPFSTNIILQIHSVIYRYLPSEGGKWKTVDNDIIERSADGKEVKVRFKPVPAFQTKQAMEELAALYNQAIEQHEALVVIPLTILDFLCIHPFLDGNGRTARLLTLILMYQYGYEVGRFISLERIIEESKTTYYESLQASSKNWHEGAHDVMPWLRYFHGTILKAYREFEQRVGKLDSGKGSKTDYVTNTIERKFSPFTISDLERDCPGVSRDMIRLVLRDLKKSGTILLQGKGRGAKWIYVRK